MNFTEFEGRKRDHIQLALSSKTEAVGFNGLDQVRLEHDALPEVSFSDISLHSTFLGERSKTPFFVAGMTAGHTDADLLNLRLATACSEKGWVLGVGSQRRQLADSNFADNWKKIRDQNPNLKILANLGASQLPGLKIEKIQSIVDSVGASALVIHLNALQETLQQEGTPNFIGVIRSLTELVSSIKTPVVLKETGCGFSRQTLKKIKGLKIKAIDVSGLGGTHWGRIEGARAFEKDQQSILGKASETFKNWGISTAESVLNAVSELKNVEVWASGGVRSGLDAAKLIALGASQVGYAKPALEQALTGENELLRWMDLQEYELRVALFCTGSQNPEQLKSREGIWTKAL